jgi:hypothetical protein
VVVVVVGGSVVAVVVVGGSVVAVVVGGSVVVVGGNVVVVGGNVVVGAVVVVGGNVVVVVVTVVGASVVPSRVEAVRLASGEWTFTPPTRWYARTDSTYVVDGFSPVNLYPGEGLEQSLVKPPTSSQAASPARTS